MAKSKELDDNLSFKGLMAAYQTPQHYIEDFKKVHSIVKDIGRKKILLDDNDSCLDIRINSLAEVAFICEWCEEEKPKSINVASDERPFSNL